MRPKLILSWSSGKDSAFAEFHSFVWAGPMFAVPVPVIPGPVVERDGFVFADLLPGAAPAPVPAPPTPGQL